MKPLVSLVDWPFIRTCEKHSAPVEANGSAGFNPNDSLITTGPKIPRRTFSLSFS